MSDNSVECPICGQSFKQISIERHVNICLLSNDEKPVTRRSSIDPSTTNNEKTPSKPREKTNFFERRSTKRKSIETTPEFNKKSCTIERLPLLPSLELSEDNDLIVVSSQDATEKKVPLKKSQKSISVKEKVGEEGTNRDYDCDNSAAILPGKGEKLPKTAFQKEILNMAKQRKTKNILESENQDKVCCPETLNDRSSQYKPEQSNIKNRVKKTLTKLVLGSKPLAEQMRPLSLDEYYGQKSVNTQNVLKDLFNSNRIPSMILWGPPGCGKTSLAHVVSNICKSGSLYRFVSLSATMSGVNDVKEVVRVAKNERKLTQRKTVLFIDEVHRFNKLQQDSFLPHVEDGTLVLIGATTENPSFHVNNALLSRCRLVVLEKLDSKSIKKILLNAITKLGGIEIESDDTQDTLENRFTLEAGVTDMLANYSGGDARIALNSLDMILQSKLNKEKENKPFITCEQIKEEMKSNHVNYDRNGDEHFWMASAFQKSIRGSNVDASLYWLARMLEGGESPLYIARRLVRCASEDIGMADSNALQQAVAAYQASHFIGMPECDVILAQAVIYLAKAPKSFSVYEAYTKAKETIRNCSGPQPCVPLHLRNAPTKLLKGLGYGKGYTYATKDGANQQEYLPEELIGTTFYRE